MLMVSLALLMNVVVTNVYSKKDTFETPPRWLVRRARRWDPKFMKNFPAADQTMTTPMNHSSPVQLRNAGRLMMSRSRTPPEMVPPSPSPPPPPPPPPPKHHYQHHHQQQDSDAETDSSSAATSCDQRQPLCCTSGRRKRKLASTRDPRSAAASVTAKRLAYTTARYRQDEFASKLQPSFDSERNSTEWQLITKYLDRQLLYLYAVISISTQLALIYVMLGSHNDDVTQDIDQ